MKNDKKPKPEPKAAESRPESRLETALQQNKKTVVTGLVLVVLAFLGVIGVIYLMANTQESQLAEIEELQEEVVVLNTENDIIERKSAELESQVGQSLNVQKVVSEAQKVYGDDIKQEKEGSLWVDRKTETLLITLGALNGISPGMRLTVYDNEERIGYVRVELPMDVISFVNPINKPIKEFNKEQYRVVVE